MSDNLDKIRITDLLDNNIFFKNRLLNLSKYEQENIGIFEKMFQNQSKINLLITPNRKVIEVLSLIILGVKLYIKNLYDEEVNILDCLNIGDIVVYQGKKVKYMGIEEKCGEKKIKLQHAGDSNNRWIRPEEYYKLSIYRGSSKKLNTMSSNRSKKRSSKSILADMLHIDLEELGGVVKQQMVVVYPNKQQLENLLNNIKIKVKDKKYYFTEIFPCKYYSNVNNSTDFKGNKLKLKEIFVFTSSLGLATELIQENKERNNLLLLGEGTYAGEIGGDLEFLIGRKKLKKIYVLNTFDKCMQLGELVERGFDIELAAWTKNVFFKSLNEIYLNNRKIYSFLNRTLNNRILEQYVDITKNLLKLRLTLTNVLGDDFYCNNKETFLRVSYGLLKVFENIVIPIKNYDEFILKNALNKYTVNKLIEILITIIQENRDYEDNYIILKIIVETIKKLKDLLYYENPKLVCIKELNLYYGDLILCSNSIEQSILEEYEFIKNKSIIVGCVKDYTFNSHFKTIVFTGVYNTKNIEQLHCYNGLNIITLLYPSEVAKYNIKINKFNKLFELIEENNSLGISNNIKTLQKIKINYDKYIKLKSTENVQTIERELEKEVNNFNYKVCFENDLEIEDLLNISIQENVCGSYLEYDSSCVKKYIKFKNGKYAFLTQFYRVKYLDEKNNTVLEKEINSLEIGDKLIFINDKTEDEITKLFYKIMGSDEFKSKYYKDYCNMKYWKTALKRYIDNYFQEYSLVVTELLLHGINKTEQAVRTWIFDKNIIGPREKNVYKVLADITNDNYFLKNWEEIYESCTLIRSLKTKLKKNLNYMVIKSVVNERAEGRFENLIYEVLGDLKQYAYIEKIYEIVDVSINMPMNKTNCMLKKEEIHEFLK